MPKTKTEKEQRALSILGATTTTQTQAPSDEQILARPYVGEEDLQGSYPLRPPTYAVRLNVSGGIRPIITAPGVYIVYGGTGSGKSLNMLALYHALHRAKRVEKDTPVANAGLAYWNVFEPTSAYNYLKGTSKSAEDIQIFNDGFYFLNPKQELESAGKTKTDCDFAKYTSKLRQGTKEADRLAKPIFLIFDSLTDAVEKFTPTARGGQRTYKGGLQPADIDFFRSLHRRSVNQNCITFAVINSDVLPITPAFEGVCEGFLVSLQPGVMSFRGRADGREERPLRFSADELNLVAPLLGYTGQSPTRVGSAAMINII